jgi:transcriptional regulator with XRE-family HTH domain
MATHRFESALARLGIEAGFKTQTARAKALGVSRNYLMIIERGERLPSKRLKQKMIEVYRVDDQAFLDAILLTFSLRDCTFACRFLLAELQKEFWLVPNKCDLVPGVLLHGPRSRPLNGRKPACVSPAHRPPRSQCVWTKRRPAAFWTRHLLRVRKRANLRRSN